MSTSPPRDPPPDPLLGSAIPGSPSLPPTVTPPTWRWSGERYQEAAEKVDQLQAVYDLAEAVSRAKALPDIYEAAIDGLLAAVKADRAAVLLFDPDGVMRFKAWHGLSDAYRQAVEGHSPWGRDSRSPAPIAVADVAAEPSLAALLPAIQEEGIRALAFVPLCSADGLMGKFMVYFDAPHVFDNDEVRLAEIIARQVAFAVERKKAEERLSLYREIFDRCTDGIAVIDGQGRYLEQNGAHLALLGYAADELDGQTPAIHLGEAVFAEVARELSSAGLLRMEVRSRTRNGDVKDLDLSAFSVRDESGRPVRFVGIKRDITERKRTERGLRTLADAGALLDASLDYEATLATVASLAVPGLADWAVADVVDERGPRRRLATTHADPRLALELRALEDRGRGGPAPWRDEDQDCAGQEALELVRRLYGGDGGGQVLIEAAGVVDAMAVRLMARGQRVGLLTLVSSDPERRYTASELQLARELARRAGLALDNARLYRESKDSDRRKDEFLAMLAHELRNPLAPILTSLQLLELRPGDSELLRRCREVLTRQVRHLARLIDDLLDVSRITRGKITLRPQRMEMAEAVSRAVDTARPMLEQRRHQVTVAVPPALWLEADPLRVEQIVSNLLANAAKYTEPGGRIRISGERRGGDVVLRVADNGAGIAADMLPHIFEPFIQGDRSLDRAQGGLGIGLTLVRGLAELHGGTVSAASPGPGRGSEFVVVLPAPASEVPAPAAAEPADTLAATAPRRRRRVLVVDDNVDAARGMAAALETWGHTVETAHDGPAALSSALRFQPDLVLLDIGLPGMDGYEVARGIRQDPRMVSTVLVALTGYGQDTDRQRSRAAGFSAHLVKPVDLVTVAALLAGD